MAGLADSDGTLAPHFNKTADGCFRLGLQFAISQAESNDRNFALIHHLHALFGVGHVFHARPRGTNHTPQAIWKVADRNELEKFLPHIIKYMVIKGGHFQRLLELRRGLAGKKLTALEVSCIKHLVKMSRLGTGPVKPKNFPSPAWIAGYVDGDGCFRIYPAKKNRAEELRLKIAFWRPDKCGVRLIQRGYGGKIYERTPTVSEYYLNMGASFRATAHKFLGAILPHLRLKKHAAEMILYRHRQRLSEKAPTGEATV